MTTSVRKALIARGLVTENEGLLHITEAGRSMLSASTPPSPAACQDEPTDDGEACRDCRAAPAPTGANIAELQAATGWQAHSVRGALSGALKTRLRLTIESRKTDAGRTYHITDAIAGTRSGTVGA